MHFPHDALGHRALFMFLRVTNPRDEQDAVSRIMSFTEDESRSITRMGEKVADLISTAREKIIADKGEKK